MMKTSEMCRISVQRADGEFSYAKYNDFLTVRPISTNRTLIDSAQEVKDDGSLKKFQFQAREQL
jgi:hypothetical protein